jgi:predicted nucleotidyltransferase
MQTLRKPQLNMWSLSGRIQLQAGEVERAKAHLQTIRGRLSKSFDVGRFIPIGSYARKTAIRRYSDVDYMVLLKRNEVKWGGDLVKSSTVLRRVRDDLDDRFVHTNVRLDQQAVVVAFGQGQHAMDVVPAIFHGFKEKYPIYWIPDGNDGWLETSPQTHNSYFAKANEQGGGKLVKTVQLLKWWKFSRSQPIPIQCFYLDMLLASSAVCNGIKSYTQCVYDSLKLLADRECRGLRDPIGIAGVIYAAKTNAQWEEVNASVISALTHARSAMVAEAAQDYQEANRQWSMVFNYEY